MTERASEKVVEAMAMAMFDACPTINEADDDKPHTWDTAEPYDRDSYRRQARAALSALTASGMKVMDGEALDALLSKWRSAVGVGSEYSLACADTYENAANELEELCAAFAVPQRPNNPTETKGE